MDDGKVKVAALGRVDHVLEFRPVVGGGAFGVVTELAHHRDAALFAEVVHGAQLRLDGFLPLVVR
ncbi:MAG: hypothetical protein VB021_09815 [Oscillospiraceae bacterium]|nr:hypothetical protein [Oscillospiraceae bacterium]